MKILDFVLHIGFDKNTMYVTAARQLLRTSLILIVDPLDQRPDFRKNLVTALSYSRFYKFGISTTKDRQRGR